MRIYRSHQVQEAEQVHQRSRATMVGSPRAAIAPLSSHHIVVGTSAYFRICTLAEPPKHLVLWPPEKCVIPRFPQLARFAQVLAIPHRWDDPHELTLDQQIRLQMEDPDPAKKRQPRLPTHRIITRDQTFTPSILTCTSGASGSAGGATSESQAPFG